MVLTVPLIRFCWNPLLISVFFTVLGLSYNDRKQGHMTLEIPEKQDKSLSQVFFVVVFVCLFSVQNKNTHTVNKF